MSIDHVVGSRLVGQLRVSAHAAFEVELFAEGCARRQQRQRRPKQF